MSKKRTTYSSAFKTKLVLELLQNAEIAMEPSKAVKEYKEQLIKSQEQNERLTALVGKVTVEKEWLAKKLKSLGSSKLKQLVDLKPSPASISINHQCQLLGINRSGMVYMAAIIDWHSKAVLSHRISNTMDVQLVMSVLNDALAKYPHPEIFNTDQGSQYTSEVHTQRLKNLGITISMDGKGRATDNICIERFWRSAKVERVYLNAYQSIGELTTDVDDYIEFYNHRRFHETLDYKKPMDVYQESIKLNQNKKKASQDVLYKKF